MSWGDTLTGWFGKSSDQTKQSTGTTTGTDNRYSNFANDPRFQGFVGNYFQQAGQSGPMNQWQTAGLNGLQGAPQYIQPGAETSAWIAQHGTQPFDVSPWYNQNVQGVVNATRAEQAYQNALRNSQVKTRAAQMGSITGSGTNNALAQESYAQHAAQDPIVAQQYYKAMQDAQNAAFQNTGQRLAAAGQGASNLNAITNWGNQLTQQGLEWWKAPWQRELAYTGQLSNVINPYGTTGTSSGQTTGYSQQNTQDHPSLAQVLGNIGQFGLSFMADGGAVPGYDNGGALGAPRLPSWMGGPNPSGGQPDATPFGADLSAPLGAPMGMPAAGNAMPQAQAGANPIKAPSLAPPPAPVASPPLGAPPPVAPAPPAPSAPQLGAPLGQPQAGWGNAPPGATTQTADVQPQPSLAKNWMNMAQGGAVGAAGDGHISGFADKVMHATRMFKEMKKELGGRVEAQPQGYAGGGGEPPLAYEPPFSPWNQPGPGEDTMAPIGPWDTTTTKYEQAPQQQGFASKLSSGWDKFGKGMGWNDPQQQKPGAPQGEQDEFGHKALAQMLQALAQRGQPARAAAADGGRIGYARGSVVEGDDDGSGSILDTISGYLPEFKLKGYYVGDKPTGPQNVGSMIGGLGSLDVQGSANKMQENTRENMLAQARAAEIWDKISGKQYLPTGPQGAMAPTASDLPSFSAMKEAGDLGPIYGGKPTPTVHQQTADTARMTAETERYKAPYEALYRRNEAIEKDPYLLGLKMRLMQKLDNNEQLTEQDFKDLSMLERIPMPGFTGQPGGFGAPKAPTTGPVGSTPSTPPSGPVPGRPVASAPAGTPPPVAAAAAPAAPAGPPVVPVASPGPGTGAPPQAPQATPGLTPETLKGAVVDGVLMKDDAQAKTNWDNIMAIPDNAALIRKTIQAKGKPVTGDWKTDAVAFVGAASEAPPGQLPVPPRVPGVLAPQPGMTRSSVPDREFMAPERKLVPAYNNESESKLIMKNMIFPGNAQALLHSPGRQAAIEEARLAARHEAEIAPKREIGQQMVKRMDELRTRMIDAGPDVMYWATGPFLGNPDSLLNKGIQALSTQDANAKLGYNMGWEARHLTHQLASRLGQLGGDKGATDAARDNLINGLSDAFKTSDMNAVFKIFNDATNMIQDMSYNKSKDPFEVLEPGTYYPKQWLERYGRRNASAPRGAPPELVQEMEKEKAAERARTGAPAGAPTKPVPATRDAINQLITGPRTQQIIDDFNQAFNAGQPGLAETYLKITGQLQRPGGSMPPVPGLMRRP